MKKIKTKFNEFLKESTEYNKDIIGKRIRLIKMDDPYTKLVNDDEGTITGIDGIGQIMVKWDNGSSLSIIPEIDEFEIID